jgi:hypothetical protein
VVNPAYWPALGHYTLLGSWSCVAIGYGPRNYPKVHFEICPAARSTQMQEENTLTSLRGKELGQCVNIFSLVISDDVRIEDRHAQVQCVFE